MKQGRDTMTIGQLARKAGISRSTLLYYDSIGLLKPSGRSRANYRRYTGEDASRLEKVRMYRQVGLSTGDICRILNSPRGGAREILEKRFFELGSEIARLREQQNVIVRMLKSSSFPASGRKRLPVMDKEKWVALLRAAGLDEEGMNKWHEEFEKLSPLSHQEFLEGLGISKGEIELIRKWSRGEMPGQNRKADT
ncbi:MAG: MerR family transcriptional regulator [Syntrophaceae bacterium]